MTKNFTDAQVKAVREALGENFNVCLNKCGNIDIRYMAPNPRNIHFVFNPQPNGKIVVRKHANNNYFVGCISIHILGCKYKNRKVYKGGYRNGGWETKDMDWDRIGFTFDEALNYFLNYVSTYPQYLV